MGRPPPCAADRRRPRFDAGAHSRRVPPAGIEELVVKAAFGPYVPGRRDWVKVNSRETAEVIVGAVTCPIRQPESVVVGLIVDGQLVIVGESVPLSKT